MILEINKRFMMQDSASLFSNMNSEDSGFEDCDEMFTISSDEENETLEFMGCDDCYLCFLEDQDNEGSEFIKLLPIINIWQEEIVSEYDDDETSDLEESYGKEHDF
ncbi:hypothetical protein RF11_13412 [Thelohanellus kitauei]|uniref:Uncharacterized protein n=1 Tax=Thelohanellus kitauei TaxID=669202 RepID=A0A0C2NG41_THEKT|nr:hypothetical protein RF11_13412 [Thelohanellus kitauei]